MGERKFDKWLAAILTLQSLISLLFVFFRIVDNDEGFYLAAAQRVSDGMTLYSDFFYPQMPLLPLAFSFLSGWGLGSLLILRLVATVAALLITCQAYSIVRRCTSDRNAALVAAFLVAFSGIFFSWHSTFKPYVFVDLALLMSFGFLLRFEASERFSHRDAFLSLLLLAVAVNFRSVFVILIPLYLYLIIRSLRIKGGSLWKMLTTGFVALLLPSIPALILLLRSPENFWFNNLIFHLHREPIEPFSALVLHKLKIFGEFVLLPQTILLLGAAVGSHFLVRRGEVKNHPIYRYAAILAGIIVVVYLIPTPIHLQYFQQSVPYLATAAIPAVLYFVKKETLRRALRSAAVLYLLGILPFVYFFMLVPHPRDQRFEWGQLRSVIGQIQRHSTAKDTLLCEWAGYAALSERAQLPGSEHVGFYFPLKVDHDLYDRNHLLTNEDIVTALNQQRPALVLIDFHIYPEWRDALINNYHLAYNIAETSIYQRNHDTL